MSLASKTLFGPGMDSLQIARVILYVRDIPKVADFYQTHFGLRPLPGALDGWLELAAPAGGCAIALHQASSAQKRGSEIKLVFGVVDVHAFKAKREAEGLKFGVVHRIGGFEFSNAKDPAGNAIQISSRGATLPPAPEQPGRPAKRGA